MKIIELYILKRNFFSFLSFLIVSTIIGWTIEILGKLNFLLSSAENILISAKFSVLFLPSILILMLPFAFLFSLVHNLSSMNAQSEMTALHATGGSLLNVAKPILLLALILSCLSFYVANFVTPKARITMRNLVANSHANFITLALRTGSFQKIDNNIFIKIGKRSNDGALLQFFLIDQRNDKTDLYYYASKAYIYETNGNNFLILEDGEIVHKDKEKNLLSILQYKSYTLDLSEFILSNKKPLIYPKDRSLLYLLNKKNYTSLTEKESLKYKTELHQRITNWVTPIVFALIVLNFLSFPGSHRQSNSLSSFLSIFFCLTFYWLRYFIINNAQAKESYILYIYLLPIATIFLFLTFLYTQKSAAFRNFLAIMNQNFRRKFRKKA